MIVAYEAALAVSIPIIKTLREGLAANRIKLLGIARQKPNAIEVRVHPALVDETHFLAQVTGAMNGIWVNADAAGPTFHYGAGAGSETTASAVAADLIDVARLGSVNHAARVPYRSLPASAIQSWPVLPRFAHRASGFASLPAFCIRRAVRWGGWCAKRSAGFGCSSAAGP